MPFSNSRRCKGFPAGPFHVTEYYELIKDDQNKEKELSLAIIMKMAKEVKYTAAFGANNLIVRI